MLLSKIFWKPVSWWNIKTSNIEYYDIQYAAGWTISLYNLVSLLKSYNSVNVIRRLVLNYVFCTMCVVLHTFKIVRRRVLEIIQFCQRRLCMTQRHISRASFGRCKWHGSGWIQNYVWYLYRKRKFKASYLTIFFKEKIMQIINT